MKTVSDTLEVSRSQQYVRNAAEGTKRGRYKTKPEDVVSLLLIRQVIDRRPTNGYRRVAAIVNRLLRKERIPAINHKRIYRIMRAHGLLLTRYTGKPTWSHEGKVMTEQSNQCWGTGGFQSGLL
jgi:hypothetical protein